MEDKRAIPVNFHIVSIALLALVTSGCATYYHQHSNFNSEFENGDLKKALETLQTNDRQADGRSRFIYYVNNGLLLSILGKYEESNDYFEKAFLFGEDYHINYVYEATAYLTNPNVTIYRGEDHEHLMLLYFKAVNYLKMNRPEQALIECRRLNIRLNQLSDKYTSDKKYQRDAFIHTLMGIIYQSTKDYNNAFIAYRNALDVYEAEYTSMFQLQAPEQLKRDMLNTAWWTGFVQEFETYRDKFGMTGYQPAKPEAELVFFWHNGLAPIKSEWSINFVIDHRDNLIVFSNPALGLAFPYKVEEKNEKRDLKQLEVFRVAFPKYVERPLYFKGATIRTDSGAFEVEMAEDISKIAFHSLEQRMMLEFSKGLLRAAVKKATEHSIRKEDDRLGALIGIVNAITEQADTRNWQTLPHSIYYSRIPMRVGENKVTFTLHADHEPAEYTFNYKADQGQTLFHTFSSLESLTAPVRMYKSNRLTID
ncbi:MAG TPA: hypothetical protein VEB86_04670 [Chryseosolibacter sp.]|nr:hypothetical protein [Chryseosolibacter sp.]